MFSLVWEKEDKGKTMKIALVEHKFPTFCFFIFSITIGFLFIEQQPYDVYCPLLNANHSEVLVVPAMRGKVLADISELPATQ